MIANNLIQILQKNKTKTQYPPLLPITATMANQKTNPVEDQQPNYPKT